MTFTTAKNCTRKHWREREREREGPTLPTKNKGNSYGFSSALQTQPTLNARSGGGRRARSDFTIRQVIRRAIAIV